jgi:hypothetical protein
VQWAIGSRTGRTGAEGGSKGCWGSLTTLVEWSLPNTRRQGATWNLGADSTGVSEGTAGCSGGLTAVLGNHVGPVLGGEIMTTLGELHAFTLGDAGAGQWIGCRNGGASARHDSKIS